MHRGLLIYETSLQISSELRRVALQVKKPSATSRYLGVTGHSPSQWKARVGKVNIGTFRTERKAAEARDEAASRLFSKYAA